jgi:hypothetical protein
MESLNQHLSTRCSCFDCDRAPTNKELVLRFVAVADVGAGDHQSKTPVSDAMTRYYQQNPYSLAVLAGDNIRGGCGGIWVSLMPRCLNEVKFPPVCRQP